MPSAWFIVRSCCLSTLDDIDWFLGESNESVNSVSLIRDVTDYDTFIGTYLT